MSLSRLSFYKPSKKHQPSERMKRNLIDPKDTAVVDAFLVHCKQGWSPRSFCGKIKGSQHAYNKLLSNNEKFRAIHFAYIKLGNGLVST